MRVSLIFMVACGVLALPMAVGLAKEPGNSARPVVQGVAPETPAAPKTDDEIVEAVVDDLLQQCLAHGVIARDREAFTPFALDQESDSAELEGLSDHSQFAAEIRQVIGNWLAEEKEELPPPVAEPTPEAVVASAYFAPSQVVQRPAHPQVEVLRSSAWSLEQAAQALEMEDLYEQADQLRQAAQRLREDARQLRSQDQEVSFKLGPLR